MRCIFIDESYDSTDGPGGNRFFVLAALKAENIEVLSSAIKEVRKKIREYNHNCKGKKKIMLQEIHEHEVHSKYPIVKKWVLHSLFYERRKVEIYAVWFNMNQVKFSNEVERYKFMAKELLILCGVQDVNQVNFDIFLDDFKREKHTQQEQIKAYLINELGQPNLTIEFKSSQNFFPLQATDIVAGTFRRNLHGQDPFNYKKFTVLFSAKKKSERIKSGILT